MLAFAWERYRAGALAEADALCAAVPPDAPEHAPALHLRGLIALARGDRAGAVELLRAAAGLRADDAALLSDLGSALHSVGAADEAAAQFRRAVALDPSNADALYNLGNSKYAAERFAAAETLYARAVAVRPGFAGAWNNLGNARAVLGRAEDALSAFSEAVARDPSLAEAYANLAHALAGLGRAEEADAAYARALALAPGNAEALNDHGNLLLGLGRADEAERLYRAALAVRPGFADAHFNLGNAMVALGRPADAVGCFRAALARDGAHAGARVNLGTTLARLGLIDDAAEQFEAAAALGRADAAFALGCVRLLAGDFSGGWAGYEARLAASADEARVAHIPRWDGRAALEGARILLHAEQGLGDTIQFVRFAPMVAARGGYVVLDVQPALVPLLADADGVGRAVGSDLPPPDLPLRCPLMSLPLMFGTDADTIPVPVPYLRAAPARRERWRAILGTRSRLRVGVAWAGNPGHANDRDRSLPAAAMAGFFARDDVEWHAVHTGLREEDAPLLSRVRRHDDRLTDFAETAALLSLMDLVVAADTSVAHLAGALGLPVWIMLPFAPDWRWMLDRDDSPWYPTARLFRQRAPGDWAGVLGALGRALDEFIRLTEGG